MAGAGLFNMAPYQWTPTANLAVQANGQALDAARSMDKKRKEPKKGGIGGSLGGIVGSIGGAALGTMVGMPQVGAMLGGMAGGALGGAMGGGGGEGAVTGAGEGLGMSMAMGSSGVTDSINKGVTDMLGNSGLGTAATGAAGSTLKGAGADGNWAHSFSSDTQSGQAMNRIMANGMGLTPNSGMQFRGMSPSSMTLPMFGGAR